MAPGFDHIDTAACRSSSRGFHGVSSRLTPRPALDFLHGEGSFPPVFGAAREAGQRARVRGRHAAMEDGCGISRRQAFLRPHVSIAEDARRRDGLTRVGIQLSPAPDNCCAMALSRLHVVVVPRERHCLAGDASRRDEYVFLSGIPMLCPRSFMAAARHAAPHAVE